MRKLRSHPPRENPEQTAAKPTLRPDTTMLQASEFLRFRYEISVRRKNCPSRLEGISKRVSRRVVGDVPFCSARTQYSSSAEGPEEACGRNRRAGGNSFCSAVLVTHKLGLDVAIHYTTRVVPLRTILLWCLMGTAIIWFLVFVCVAIRHYS